MWISITADMVISYRPPAERDRRAERKKDGLAVFCRHSRFCDIRCNAVLISCHYTDLLQSTRCYCEVLIEPILCISKKVRHAAFGHNFGKMQTDFQNSLTGRFTKNIRCELVCDIDFCFTSSAFLHYLAILNTFERALNSIRCSSRATI